MRQGNLTRLEAPRHPISRLVGSVGLAAALLLGAHAGVGQATPDASDSTQVESPSDHKSGTPPKAGGREGTPQRTGAITPRERRTAREQIRQSVVDLGLQQVGKRYARGGQGPHAFDCSGFTVFAWRSAGVTLTHFSVAQHRQVRRVAPESAMPGDLVFYLNRGARHVALYIGDGKIVHASTYGVGVIVSPVRGTPWTNKHFTGFGRVDIPNSVVDEFATELRKRR